MPLEEYKRKRKFGTPEPVESEEQPNNNAASFVVHKHDATRLHYDLRLELDGVLKSWAVPKGFDFNSRRPHLAIMVEDHPIEYQFFEGLIPKGHYGAGPVIIWDRGSYSVPSANTRAESDEMIRMGIERGKFSIRMKGNKISGDYALSRMDDSKNWLLFSKRGSSVNGDESSIKSGKNLNDLTVTSDDKLDKESMPLRIEPMLSAEAEWPFNRPNWYFEPKWDGYRAIGRVENGRVQLRSRHGNIFNDFKVIEDELSRLDHSVILDGEIIAVDENGKQNFNYLQNFRSLPSGKLEYRVFDLLFLNGHDLRTLPLQNRLELLENVLKVVSSDKIHRSDFVLERGEDYWNNFILPQGFEGMVAKNLNSKYYSGRRSNDWLKIKTTKTQDAVIVGYEISEKDRIIKSLLLAAQTGNELVFIGQAGSGISEQTETDLLKEFEKVLSNRPWLKIPKSRFQRVWLKPQIVCEVAYTEFTPEKLLRHPVFLRLRKDKAREETEINRVVREANVPVLLSEREKDSKLVRIEGRDVLINNFRKLYWPEERISKFDLVQYYLSVSEHILPYLLNRPESLNRFPHGIIGDSFYQKDTRELNLPDWVSRVEIESAEDEKAKQYLICDNAATLAYMVNLGCIEINPWLSQIQGVDFPDFGVIDLDPLDISFSAVIEAALVCHEILDQLTVPNYIKTSGATGLHIYIPLGKAYTYEEARNFAELVCNLAHQRLLKTTSLERSPAKREKRVYLDFLQNKRGATLASVFAVRPKSGATLSMPLSWQMVNSFLKPVNYHIMNFHEEFNKIGNQWANIYSGRTDIQKAIELMDKKNDLHRNIRLDV